MSKNEPKKTAKVLPFNPKKKTVSVSVDEAKATVKALRARYTDEDVAQMHRDLEADGYVD
jgi:hypothetical protein